MSSKISPLLEPYLALPLEASLILLTSVLGASTNWLVLRFLHSALLSGDASLVDGDAEKVVLVIDQLDLLMATAGDQVGVMDVTDLLMGLREDVRSVIITLSADYPLLSTQQTPLETNHAAFLLNVAHQADLTLSLRLLDSGTARDVSGVVRITTRDQEMHDSGLARKIEERELLYFVGGDGGVRVFERGQ
ncbi:putative UPF0405 protein C3H7.10 [Tricladium varicosporioides]|nr:putative UPF0405 protein C3H7.10 [Hymenoscyphus varicosporioides]